VTRKFSAATRRKLQRGIALLAVLGLLVVIVVVAILDRRVTQQFEGRRWTLPARVYAQPVELYAGQRLSSTRFAAELARLGYIAQSPVDRPGIYRRKGDTVDVYVRDFAFADERQPAQRLKVSFQGETVTALAGDGGTDVPVFRLDPLLIGSIFPIHGEDRIVVSPDQVPDLLPAALKAVEDRKFDTHHGVNPLAILRALFVNVRAGQVEQGGSTLTQQLVKSYFLDSRRTLRRKVEEAIMAFILESRFEKADIMNAYINEIYLGQDGRRAVHGFGLASQFYFGKPLSELNLQEVALMVAIVRGPSYYDPRRHAERALERRNLVLKVLAEQGVVPAANAERAAKRPLGITDNAGRTANYFPAFLDLVRRQLREDYPEDELTEAGLTVFSTLDPLLQEKAEVALSEELARQDKSGRKGAKGLEGSIVVTTPQTGEIVAVVGGRRASFDGFNRALDMKRPIGSLAKPLVYLAALESGRYTPASTVMDEPVEIKLDDGNLWKPGNYDQRVHGPVTLVRALTQSYNLATVTLGLDVGLGPVTKTYVELGLDDAPPKYPSAVQHARERGFSLPAARRARRRRCRAQAAQGAGARSDAGCHGGSHLCARPADDRGVRTRHRTIRQALAAAGPGRGRQDRHVQRLPRQLVRRIFRRTPDRRVDGPRRQLTHGTHRHDRRAAGVDAADGVDRHVPVRAAAARGRRGPLGRLLHRPGNVTELHAVGGEPAFRSRAGDPAEPVVPARHDARGRGVDAADGGRCDVGRQGGGDAATLIRSRRGPDNRRPRYPTCVQRRDPSSSACCLRSSPAAPRHRSRTSRRHRRRLSRQGAGPPCPRFRRLDRRPSP
jgi:penicillin-binding protein 1B